MQGMSASYIPYCPEQQQLLPSALQDWLPEGHLAYFISDTVDSLSLNGFHARYAKDGPRNQPFHPAMMVKVLVYAYAKAAYRKRKWIAEPPNGWIKHVLGFRRFSMRGLDEAKAEFKLVCLTLNLRRMGAMQRV